MTKVRAALTQTVDVMQGRSASLDDVHAANLAHHLGLIAQAKKAGVKIICLGELFSAPYFALEKNKKWLALAEDARTGPTVRLMRDIAKRFKMVIVAPIFELDGKKRYNTAVVIDSSGRVLGKYRKMHIPCGSNEQGEFAETFYYGRGDKKPYFPVFKTSVGTIGVAICYDRHFEGVVKRLAENGARLIFSPAVTFGAKSRRMWDMEFLVDACRHRVYIGGSNRLGSEKPWGQKYFGASYFAGPDGEKLKNLSRNPKLVIADVDLGALEKKDPSGWDLDRDSRPKVFSAR